MKDEVMTSSNQEGIDLDPFIHPERWERLVTRINEAAAPLLAARRPATLAQIVAGWHRPLLVGTTGLAAAAGLALLLYPDVQNTTSEASLAEAVVPWTVAAWMEGSYAPTVEELVQAYGPESTP